MSTSLNRLKIGTKIGTSFALGVAVLAGIGFISFQNAVRMQEATRREIQAYQVMGELERVVSSVKDAETGQRGYIITGEVIYLQPYNTALNEIDEHILLLRELIGDHLTQQRNLDDLEVLIAERLAILQEVAQLREQEGFEAAAAIVRTDRGREIMSRLRRQVQVMRGVEQEVLAIRAEESRAASRQMQRSILVGIPLYALLLGLIGYLLGRNISKPLEDVSQVALQIADGNLSAQLPDNRDREDEIGVLTQTFNTMVANLRSATQRSEEQNWLKSSLAEFTRLMQGQRNLERVANLVLSELATLAGSQHGVFYLLDQTQSQQPVLRLLSSYAYRKRKHLSNQFHLGEGLVGQCALEKERILLTQVPTDYVQINSGLGAASPLNIVVLPILFENQVAAVIELASFQQFSEIQLALLDEISEGIGVILNTIAADMRNEELLRQAQALTEELQSQQEELKESNQLLEEQAEELRQSEEVLKQQQEELQQSNEELQQLNEELEEKAELLAQQNQEVERKNQQVEQAREALEEKAAQLALTSKYKSEFLANMSHELRTPLNSLLILAKLLTDNPEGNLSEKQVEYTRTIYSAGTDLLELINDILDLAKIESGSMSVDVESVIFNDLHNYLRSTFGQVAEMKQLSFEVEIADDVPDTISTDPKRLQQVLKNLLSNAFKFTEQGGVTLRIGVVRQVLDDKREQEGAVPAIAFAVQDTGIGIPLDKQQIIFEAFQQADGTTSRKYGGTGLGLSISREIAHLLGGKLQLVSQPGAGSTFTLYLPQVYQPVEASPQNEIRANGHASRQPTLKAFQSPALKDPAPVSPTVVRERVVQDDQGSIYPGDRTLLIIEDDVNFARIRLDMARQAGFKGLVALRSNDGLSLAREFIPDAIMLDILLPDLDGWTVLDLLKHDPNTRHIPIHIISAEPEQQRGMQLGAIAYLQKPVAPEVLVQALTNIKGFVERQVKHLLVVEDDAVQAASIRELIGNGDVLTQVVATGAEALSALREKHFDCVVLDLGLPDMDGFELIEQIKQEERLAGLPIIVYTGKELTRPEETRLKRLAESIIIKDVRSPERLLDETALFLHRIQANLPQSKRRILEQLHQTDSVLAHKKVLIVDDDVRNIFALTSLLERYQMDVIYAENGRDALQKLESNADVDIILMDVMMPEMDGYETTRAVRQQDVFQSLPIIALTAKAMQGDREKCIEAGASDYISKPINTEQLLSLLRVWLYR